MISGTFYTLEEVANRLQRHRNTIARWIKSGKLPAAQLGNVVLIRKEDLEAFGSKRDLIVQAD